MSHYREVVQCKKCGKIYRSFYFPNLHSYYGRGFTCGKCGWHNHFTVVSAKPKLFGLKGWEPKKASNYYGDTEVKMSCPDCGKKVPVLFNSLKEADNHCTKCLKKYRKEFVAEQKRKRGEEDNSL